MREILFRGKRVNGGEWIEGYYCTIHDSYNRKDKSAIFPCGDTCLNGDGAVEDYCFVNPETVGQFIGETDKTGRNVFEGDIVQFKGVLYAIRYIEKYLRFAAVKPNTVFCAFNFSQAEIVGNIYDNPELLGGFNEQNVD